MCTCGCLPWWWKRSFWFPLWSIGTPKEGAAGTPVGTPPRYLLHLRQPQLVLGQGLQRQLCPLSLEEVACGRVLACGQHTGGAQDCPAGLSCVLAQPCPSRAARVLACPFRNPRILGVQSAALGLQKPVLMPGRAQTREPHASCLSSAAELLRSLVQRWPPAYAACSALAGEGLAVDILHIPQAPWGGGRSHQPWG